MDTSTFIEVFSITFGLWLVLIPAMMLLSALGIKGGGIRHDFDKHSMFSLFLLMIVIAPLLEEIVFRIIPSAMLSKFTDDICWTMGVITSILFALLHGMAVSGNKLHVPIGQFFVGMMLWYIVRVYGFEWAFLSHAMFNGFAWAIIGIERSTREYLE